MFLTKNISIRNEIIKSITVIILSVALSYSFQCILHLPFTLHKLFIAIIIPALILPFFVIPNYKQKKKIFLAEQELKMSLEEKNELVQEVHHRVQNNLSIILSLLHLQEQTAFCKENPDLCHSNFERRINTISMAHSHILNSPNYSTMNLSDFIQEQKDHMIMLVNNPYRQIKFNIDPNKVKISLVNAVPIGLIISELLMNSFQHAFQDRDEGEISIQVIESDLTTKIIFEDDGMGISDDIISEHADTIGMTLISILAEQVKGKYDFQNNNRTVFTLTFNN